MESPPVKYLEWQLKLIFAAIVANAACVAAANSTGSDNPSPLVLENTFNRIEVEREHGRLLRLLDRKGQIDLKSPVALAENFRLILPLPDDPRHCIYGKNQNLSRMEITADSLVLHWDGPMKDARGAAHDSAATMRIGLRKVVLRGPPLSASQ